MPAEYSVERISFASRSLTCEYRSDWHEHSRPNASIASVIRVAAANRLMGSSRIGSGLLLEQSAHALDGDPLAGGNETHSHHRATEVNEMSQHLHGLIGAAWQPCFLQVERGRVLGAKAIETGSRLLAYLTDLVH